MLLGVQEPSYGCLVCQFDLTILTCLSTRDPDLNYEWHKIRIVMAEMIHFIRQLQAFCQLEVIECQWKSLLDFIGKKEGDLDALVDAHRNYLDRIVKKLLLLSPKAGREVSHE